MKVIQSKVFTAIAILALMVVTLSSVSVASAMELGAHETTRWTNVHDGPGGPALAGIALPPSTAVNVATYDGSGNWAQVSSDVASGWVPSNALRFVGANNSGGSTADCVIPESGPWPNCATGGSSTGGASDGCVIPDSGPWPPCATGGNSNPPADMPTDSGDCVIPESGPWPPCATSGNSGGEQPAPPADNSNTGFPGPNSEPLRFDTTPEKPFDAEEFRTYLGQFRDSLRSFVSDLGQDRPLPCSSFRGWYILWTQSSPVYTDVPDAFKALHVEWRWMLNEIVENTEGIQDFCFGNSPGTQQIDITETVNFLLWAYPTSEAMVAEANSIPNP